MEILHKNITVEEEYKRNPDLKREDIQETLNWIKTQPHLPPVTELLIIQFLHSNYYDLEKTKKSIESFFTCRTHFDDIFSNLDVLSDELVQASKSITIFRLPGITPEGYMAWIWKWNDPDPETFCHPACVKYYLLFVMMVINDYGSCPGYIIILDFEGSKIGHLFKLHLQTMKHSMKFVQEALPARLKKVHVLNFPLAAPLPILKPFLNPNLYHMLQFNKTIKTIYKQVPEQMFPKDYPGGKAPSVKELREYWCQQITQRRERFLEEERTYKVDESKRIVVNKSWFG